METSDLYTDPRFPSLGQETTLKGHHILINILKILNGFPCNLHNKVHFCKSLKPRGSNPMF